MKNVARLTGLLVVLAVSVGLFQAFSMAADDAKEEYKPKHTIKEVMACHKGDDSLLNKIKGGDASAEEKLKLLDAYISLFENKPPKGEPESWMHKSGSALMAAAKVAVGREGSLEELSAAVNCAACHKEHKPSAS